MHKKRKTVAAVVLGALLVGWSVIPRTSAEVSAEVDAYDNYVRTVVFTNASAKNVKIWSARNSPWNRVPLNPDGDLTGDLWPVIVENPADMNHPWVVWSRHDGTDYDLAWSRWNWGEGWQTIAPVVEGVSGAGDDLDPSVVLDPTGRPYLAWWRNEGGHGQVYFTVFLSSRWMDPVTVSDPLVDSRSPVIGFEGSAIRIEYRTPQGPVSRDIVFAAPETINDDINPFENVVVGDTGGPSELGQ
jgi:hypothetical protein